MNKSILYVVATPVGNLADMTPRAVDILRSVSLILAEDTRTSRPLLEHFNITTPLESHHKYNEHASIQRVIDRLLQGASIALISDAGTPGISDPGFLLSRECRRNDIAVVTLPGPTAFVPALVNSGLPIDRFAFEGFLPQKKGRETRIAEIAESTVTTVIYESPLRLTKTLQAFTAKCGEARQASVSREISKLHESTVRGTLGELVQYFSDNPPRGEIVIILGPKEKEAVKHRNKYRDDLS